MDSNQNSGCYLKFAEDKPNQLLGEVEIIGWLVRLINHSRKMYFRILKLEKARKLCELELQPI